MKRLNVLGMLLIICTSSLLATRSAQSKAVATESTVISTPSPSPFPSSLSGTAGIPRKKSLGHHDGFSLEMILKSKQDNMEYGATRAIYGLPLPQAREPAIMHIAMGNVYDFFEPSLHNETIGYGRQTYVLLNQRDDRGAALLQTIVSRAGPARELGKAERLRNNIFEIPVYSAFIHSAYNTVAFSATDGIDIVGHYYDIFTAQQMIKLACRLSQSQHLCGFEDNGPFLVTFAKPQSQLHIASRPFLLVNLSHVPVDAYAEFVAATEDEINTGDLSDRSRIETFRLRLLKLITATANILPKWKKAVLAVVH